MAIKYIYKFCENKNIKLLEFNINQNINKVYLKILEEKADVMAFSTYIWNAEYVFKLTSDLKKACPNSKIILGGPEVSFDTEEILKKNPQIDIIIRGEGELTSKELFYNLENGFDLKNIFGISYREGEKIFTNNDRGLIQNLDEIPSPFENIKNKNGKILYYEISRGCPFNCSYCLSSTIKGVRSFSKDRIKKDLIYIMNSGANVVKLVDRTFNANEKESMEVMNFIMENVKTKMCFHFELMAHLISDEFLEFLKDVPKGLFQFEIGIQSKNERTLHAINRKTDLARLSYVVKKIKSYGNIHQHVDLIAGLPFEDFSSFKESFNYAYSLNAEKLQLGFLKLLRGSKLRMDSEKYGIIYSENPPYEVISTNSISASELNELKLLEDVVEKYSNEDYFENTFKYLIKDDAFGVFYDFSKYWGEMGYFMLEHSRVSLYKILYEYLKSFRRDDFSQIVEILRFDFLKTQNLNPPEYLNGNSVSTSICHKFLKEEKVRKLFEIDLEIPTKRIVSNFRLEKFKFGGLEKLYGFYYSKNSAAKIKDLSEWRI